MEIKNIQKADVTFVRQKECMELNAHPICRKCGADNTRPSHRKFWERPLSRLMLPFRCRVCHGRFRKTLFALRSDYKRLHATQEEQSLVLPARTPGGLTHLSGVV